MVGDNPQAFNGTDGVNGKIMQISGKQKNINFGRVLLSIKKKVLHNIRKYQKKVF